MDIGCPGVCTARQPGPSPFLSFQPFSFHRPSRTSDWASSGWHPGRGHSARNVNLRGSTVTSAMVGGGKGEGRASKLLAGKSQGKSFFRGSWNTLALGAFHSPFRIEAGSGPPANRRVNAAPPPPPTPAFAWADAGTAENFCHRLVQAGREAVCPRRRTETTGKQRRGSAQVAGSAWPPAGGRAERSQGPGRGDVDRRRPRSNGGAARPAAARERPLARILRLRTADAWSQPQVGAAGCAAPRPRARRERRNPTSVCHALAGPQLQAQGEERRGGGEALSQAMTVCGGLFRVSFSGDPGALLLAPLRRLPIVPALRTAGDGGPRQQGGPSPPTPLRPAPRRPG